MGVGVGVGVGVGDRVSRNKKPILLLDALQYHCAFAKDWQL